MQSESGVVTVVEIEAAVVSEAGTEEEIGDRDRRQRQGQTQMHGW